MEFEFRTKKLRREYEDHRRAEKVYGRQVARRYIDRVNIIRQVRTFEELQSISALDCHPLKGNWAGQWALKLTGQYRLIITLQGEALDIVRIEEVSKHYDD